MESTQNHEGPSSKTLLFSDIRFIIAQCNDVDSIKSLLIDHGAKHINYLSDDVTLVISDTNCPEAEEAADIFDKQVVTSLWVHLCLKANKLLPTTAFSPLKSIFLDVVASFSSDLSKQDVEVLAATLTYYGAKVSKDITSSTHFITASAEPTDLPNDDKTSNTNKHIDIVAPDWVLESAKLKRRCDEQLFDPKCLLPQPPPTPTPPPIAPEHPVESVSKGPSPISESKEQQHKIEDSNQPQAPQMQSQTSQFVNQQNHNTTHSQLSRPRLPANIIRGPQPRFRPLLPPNNQSMMPRPMMQQPRVMGPDQQQPKKVTINYPQYRKVSPYQNNIDPQQQNQMQQPMPQYAQPPQPPPQHMSVPQPQGNMMQQPNRLPQPNMYHQVRAPYQNSHMPPRGLPQQPLENQQQQQHPHQPTQMVTRFQDPNAQMGQRPYQVCLQPQGINPSYPQNNMPRPPIYYTQGHPVQMRMPQHGPPMRHVQSEQVVYDNFNQPHNQDQMASQHYSGHQVQSNFPLNHPQPMHQQSQQIQHQHQTHQIPQPQPQPQPSAQMIQPRQQFQSNLSASGHSIQQVRTARTLFNNQQELPKTNNIRHHIPSQPPMPQTKATRMPICSQNQLHPSIFTQESNMAQIKAKIPVVKENFDYYGHDPKENVPKDLPFVGCVFKFIGYNEVEPRRKSCWIDAIKLAGGLFENDLNNNVTHLICEDRSSREYSLALSMGIRCVTVYWINDVLAKGTLTYPWKALHLPLPFTRDEPPLPGITISVSNFHHKERSELREMVRKAGAKFTDSFSTNNSLLICRTVTGDKYERAVEWKVPITNCHILSDILLNGKKDFNLMLNQTKYQLFDGDEPFKLKSYLEIQELMKPWKKPLSVTKLQEPEKDPLYNSDPKSSTAPLNSNEDSGLATGGSNNSDIELISNKEVATSDSIYGQLALDNDIKGTIQNHKIEGTGEFFAKEDVDHSNSQKDNEFDLSKSFEHPTEATTMNADNCLSSLSSSGDLVSKGVDRLSKDIDQVQKIPVEDDHTNLTVKANDSNQISKSVRKSKDPVRILMTHMDSTRVKQLESYALKLGMGFASQPNECTHLITDRISRTSKFICAFSHATHILSYKWIVESHESNQLLDEKPFILQDQLGEEKYSFNLVYSLLKRRKRSKSLFYNYVFFVTPKVVSNITKVKEMIETNGGVFVTKKLPTKRQVEQLKAEGKRFVVVTCRRDSHLFPVFGSFASDIVDIEFVVSGILRQDIDFEPHRIKILEGPFTRPELASVTQIAQPSPQKRLKLDDSR